MKRKIERRCIASYTQDFVNGDSVSFEVYFVPDWLTPKTIRRAQTSAKGRAKAGPVEVRVTAVRRATP